MTDTTARIVSGLLFLVFSPLCLSWLRREYKQQGKLSGFGSLLHVVMYGFHGMFCGTLAWGAESTVPPIGTLAWLGLPLMVVGAGVTFYAMDLFQKFSRWLGCDTPGLQTNKLYRYSRNPQFVGYGLFILGFFLAWWNSLAWVGLLAYAALVYVVTLVEEEHLIRTYGESYREYCQQVPRYLGLPKRS
jgi:protein-S-isoprenylcysteine O-methyltransferase Ste14